MQHILQQFGLKTAHFEPTSRYFGLEVAVYDSPRQGPVAYVRRRIIAPPEHFQLLHKHTVAEGERPDNVAAQHLGDPEQFWRICDANAVMSPNELTDEAGKKIRITLPEGIPGVRNA